MKRFAALFISWILLNATASMAVEEHMLMARIQHDFPEAMSLLQKTIGEYGYTVSRIQHIDVGLSASGFQTDRYRIVFFGKPEEIRRLSQQYPQMIPYLPLMMTILSEGDETLVVATDPLILGAIASDPDLEQLLQRWQSDMRAIMDEMRLH